MKDIVEIEKVLKKCVEDDLVGFFKIEKRDFEQEVRIFTLVHKDRNFFSNVN
jgi:hypothetical protein